MKLSLEALQILDAIDRRGSFAGAAKVLYKVPSTISYTVAKLEEDLGVQLFDRVGPRAELTEAGRALLDEGRHLLRAARELELRVRRVASGWETELTLAVDGANWIVEVGQPWRNERAGLKDPMLVKGVKLTVSGHKHSDPKKKVFKAERLVIDGKTYDLYPDRN